MDISTVWNVLGKSLIEYEPSIVEHIAKVTAEKRSTRIESVFAQAFFASLPPNSFKKEVAGHSLGIGPQFPGRTRATLDCYIPEMGMAIEFKAGRIPRTSGNELFDISQVAADIIRLRASSVKTAYVILFVYGPMVTGTETKGQLYKAFHNSYFVDYSLGAKLFDSPVRQQVWQRLHCARARELGWNSPWPGGGTLPEGVVVKRTEQLGAICIDCMPGMRIPKACLLVE